MVDYEGIFTPEEIRAVEAFIESIAPELAELGDGGEIEINWDEKKIYAKSDSGNIKEFDFKHIMRHLQGSLH